MSRPGVPPRVAGVPPKGVGVSFAVKAFAAFMGRLPPMLRIHLLRWPPPAAAPCGSGRRTLFGEWLSAHFGCGAPGIRRMLKCAFAIWKIDIASLLYEFVCHFLCPESPVTVSVVLGAQFFAGGSSKHVRTILRRFSRGCCRRGCSGSGERHPLILSVCSGH